MKKNKLSIIFAILTFICIFSVTAIVDQCGCKAVPIEEKIDVEEAEEEIVEEEAPPEEEAAEEEVTEVEEELPEEEAPEEEEPEEETAPTIELQIYEGPTYSSADSVCYYRIEAVVSGTPTPSVEFSKDDSLEAWGPYKAQVNLYDPSETYNLTATATNSASTATDSITISWGCNRPPEITEIILPSGTLYPDEQYDVSVMATDPDGDSLSYEWSTSADGISDIHANPTQWTTPPSAGSCTITVTVNDGKGGEATQSEDVTVAPPLSIGPPIDEVGFIEEGTDIGSLAIVVGDSSHNLPMRGFFSFSISGLSGAKVKSATLTFNDFSPNGNPDPLIEAIWLEVVNWGPDILIIGDFGLTGTLIEELDGPLINCSAERLKTELQEAIDNGQTRFQMRIRHRGMVTNNNSIEDSWQYHHPDINLSVEYIP